jgi:hypothetical protein
MSALQLTSSSGKHTVDITAARELTLSQRPPTWRGARRTRSISPHWMWLSRPLFRYSRTFGGYVLRHGWSTRHRGNSALWT